MFVSERKYPHLTMSVQPVVSVTGEVNPLKLINPLSPFADLFVNIYNVTKPSSEWMKNYDPHMLKRDTNKICSESCPSSSSPGSSYGDFEQKVIKKRDLVTFKSKEGDIRPRLEENNSGPLPLSFQCCNRLFKDSTDLAMHQKSYTHQSYQMDNRLDIDEQTNMDPSPVRIEWLRRLMGEEIQIVWENDQLKYLILVY